MPRPLILLGPQRLRPTLVSALDELGVDGPVAAVTAGWQEREAEVEEMREHVGRPVVNLMLHARSDRLFAADAEFAARYRARQERLRQLQELYRLRLAPAVKTARLLLGREGDRKLLDPERRAAIRALRTLDAHHLKRLKAVHEEFEATAEPAARPALRRHRRELAAKLRGAGALAIAGGHVAVLLNRLRLFGVLELAPDLPIVAWSAGAMVLGQKVVLFHDHPPQGAGDAEVLEAGLGLFSDLVPLPHARHRLRLGDPGRVGLFARRFAPAACVAMDGGSRLVRAADGASWRANDATFRLTARGTIVPAEGA
jgi:hypothetical protein